MEHLFELYSQNNLIKSLIPNTGVITVDKEMKVSLLVALEIRHRTQTS